MRAMNLNDYLDSLTAADKRDFAARCGIKAGYLKQLKCRTARQNNRMPSLALCKQFIEESERRFNLKLNPNKLTLEELRPDVYDTQSAA
jgi:hypothetical protein